MTRTAPTPAAPPAPVDERSTKRITKRITTDERITTAQQALDRLHDEQPLGRVRRICRPVIDDDDDGVGRVRHDVDPYQE